MPCKGPPIPDYIARCELAQCKFVAWLTQLSCDYVWQLEPLGCSACGC